ncbi:uncharacterized protein [Prorops nasuta]|uniref:uncharacterized protein n=1 Tax=Prorops nasuta TaxID=863751 RepID=UPI0034CEB6CD
MQVRIGLLLVLSAMAVMSSEASFIKSTELDEDKPFGFGENFLTEINKILESWKESLQWKKKTTVDTVKNVANAKLSILNDIKNKKIHATKDVATFKINAVKAAAEATHKKMESVKSKVAEKVEEFNSIKESIGQSIKDPIDSFKKSVSSAIASHPLITATGDFLASHTFSKFNKHGKHSLLPSRKEHKPTVEVQMYSPDSIPTSEPLDTAEPEPNIHQDTILSASTTEAPTSASADPSSTEHSTTSSDHIPNL